MKSIPVDTSRTQFLVAGEPRPVTDRAGVQRTNSEGQALVQVPLIAVVEGQSAETLTVKVPGALPPMQQLMPVRVTGLVARAWAMEGSSGVSFTAASIVPVSKP